MLVRKFTKIAVNKGDSKVPNVAGRRGLRCLSSYFFKVPRICEVRGRRYKDMDSVVSKFDCTIIVKEDITWGQKTMNNTSVVQEYQSSNNTTTILFFQSIIIN